MPAQGVVSGHSEQAERVVRRKKKARIKRAVAQIPKPKEKVRLAKAQARQYPSQAKQLKTQAKRQHKAAERKIKRKQAHAAERAYRKSENSTAKLAFAQRRELELRRRERAGRGAGVRAVKRELEGKGLLAKAGKALGGLAASQSRKSASITPAGRATRADVGGGSQKIAENALKDVVNAPAQAIPSVYVPAAAAVEAARGRPERGKAFIKNLKETDPVYNTVAAGVEAARGNSKAAKSHLEKAKKSATEHPGFTALEIAGVKGGVGRATSRGLRGTGRALKAAGAKEVGEKVRKAGSTERTSKKLHGTSLVEERAYSRDSFTKARQVLTEKSHRKRARKLREQASRAESHGHHQDAERLRKEARDKNPDRVTEHEIRRRVDERIQVNEDIRRHNRAVVTKNARKVLKAAKREQGAVSVVAQRIAHADKSDLRDYIRELDAEYPNLGRSQKRANRDLREQLQKVVDDSKADMGRLQLAADAYQQLTAPIQKKLVKRGVLSKKQQERRAAIPYAVRRMGAHRDKEGVLVDAKGKELTTEVIVAHMREHKVDPAAYITQAPSQRGARNFNIRSERIVDAGPYSMSGKATKEGTFDAHPDVLVENAARTQGLLDATEGFRSTIKEFAYRDNGKVVTFKSKKAADQAARDAALDENGRPNPEAHALRAVRIAPFRGHKDQLEKLLEDVNSLDQDQFTAIHDSMRDAVMGKAGAGKWVLIPEAAAKRIQEHLDVQGGGGGIKTLQLANQAFRRTVLSTSTSWFAGNIIEGLGRAALAHAGPRSYVTGRRTLGRLREIDPKMADEALSRLVGGGHFMMADRAHIRRGAEQFSGTKLEGLANALGKFWRAPGPKQAAHAWHAYTEFVFRALNGRAEQHIQTAMLGAALRKSPLMDQRVLKLGSKAIDEAARGLKNTETQVRFGRAVDDMYGKYGKFSPSMKKAVSTYTPFVAWWLNAVYFVTRTLPRDHPVVTGLIASAEMATEEWRKDHGLDFFIEGAAPLFLQGSIPTGDGGKLRLSRYTPFGAFSDPTGTVAGQVLPIWQGIGAALQGRDWKGNELRVKDVVTGKTRPANPVERAVAAAEAMVEATVPAWSTAKRVKEQGPKALNPLRITKGKQSSGGSRRLKPYKPGGEGFFGGSSSSKPTKFFGGGSSGATNPALKSSSGSQGGSFFGG